MIYGPRSTGPAGPGRAPFGITKSKERKENIWIEALKTKLIRTALKFLKNRKIVHPNRLCIHLWGEGLMQSFGDVVTMA